jgi:hypothetical protein
MPIEVLIEQHHKLTYADNVKMVAQQMQPRIRPTVTSMSVSGEAVRAADLFGRVRAIRGDGRDFSNPDTRAQNTARWLVRPNSVYSGQPIDRAEMLDRAMDPTSQYTRAHVAAVMREIDDIILGSRRNADGTYSLGVGGILGSAVEGKRPTIEKVFPAANYIANASTGLTLEKLMTAQRTLQLREFGIDTTDTIYCGISPFQVTDLLQLADGNGTALNAFAQEQLKSGRPTPLMGMTWVVGNNYPKVGNVRYCPVWTKNNVVAGVWQDIRGTLFKDTSKQELPQVLVDAYIAATRIEDDGVLIIECVEP